MVDGTFLQRPEIVDLLDLTLSMDTTFPIAMVRGAERDAAQLGGIAAAGHLFETRYYAACRRFIAELAPQQTARYVVDNSELRPAPLSGSRPQSTRL